MGLFPGNCIRLLNGSVLLARIPCAHVSSKHESCRENPLWEFSSRKCVCFRRLFGLFNFLQSTFRKQWDILFVLYFHWTWIWAKPNL